MNPSQKPFYDYMITRTTKGNEQKMTTLLEESFSRQNEGRFSKAYLMEMVPQMLAMLAEDKRDEVMAIVKEFGASHVNSGGKNG